MRESGHVCFGRNEMSCGELLPINVVCLTNLLWISAINLRAGEDDEPVAHNHAQPRSRLEWHHLSGDHIKVAVGGVDFSSVQRHLTPLDVYLARSHADAKWCQHLFFLPITGSWSFFCFFHVSHTHSMPFPPVVPTIWLFVLLCGLWFFAPCRSRGFLSAGLVLSHLPFSLMLYVCKTLHI